MKKTLLLLFFVALCLLLSACGGRDGDTDSTEAAAAVTLPDATEMLSENDRTPSYTEASAATVTLSGDTVTASTNAVRQSAKDVIITDEGTYILTGSYCGRVVVDAEATDNVTLVLRGVALTSDGAAALYIKEAKNATLLLDAGGENALTASGEAIADGDTTVDAALFSRTDLLILGEGALAVSSAVGHGIVCKDDLKITGGRLTVTASGHGLDANDSVRLATPTLTVNAGSDAIHAESTESDAGFVYIESGTYTLSAGGDGISASSSLSVVGGSFAVTAGGGCGTSLAADASAKGLKAGTDLAIGGGTLLLNTADDALHANGDLTVHAGSLTLTTGDDGIHADGTLTILGGTLEVRESYEGLEGLHILISGGDIRIKADDDGLNAAGGQDASGTGGMMPGGDPFGRPGGPHGGMHGGGMGGGMSAGNGSITLAGGTLYINASGDGIDANGTLTISGGSITVCGPTQGDTAVLDYDSSATITGGTFIGTGSYMMAQSFSESGQGVLALTVGNQNAGVPITLTDASGELLLSYTPALPYQIVILSTPDMVKGEVYTITVGSLSGSFEAN